MTTPINTEVKLDINKWLATMYKADISDEELIKIYETIKYQGFNREEVLIELAKKNFDKKVFAEIIILCALRGPVQASKTPLSTGQTLMSYGVSASGGKGNKKLTCAKITAATADLAAYYMRKLNVPKRIDSPLPAWLQFPAAGSIKLPDEIRIQHREFSKDFSKKIKGTFNEDIYQNMMANSYLNKDLKLF